MSGGRPCYCFDKSCKILHVSYNKIAIEQGYSYFCFGKLKEPHRFVEKECKHINEYCYCAYTPLKGAIRFFINKGDAWNYQIGVCNILNDAEPLICDECGVVNRIGDTVIHFDNGDKLCPMCAVRLKKKKWNPKEKRYELR